MDEALQARLDAMEARLARIEEAMQPKPGMAKLLAEVRAFNERPAMRPTLAESQRLYDDYARLAERCKALREKSEHSLMGTTTADPIDPRQASEPPRPSLGRIVHYTAPGDGSQQAAIITGVNEDGSVALKAFFRHGSCDMDPVYFSETYAGGYWSWPPRVV